MDASLRSLLASGIEACVGIVRSRKGPEDVPASATLLVLALLGTVLLGLALGALPGAQVRGSIFVRVALDVGVWLVAARLLLHVAGRPERYLQTVTAIFGCQLVLAPVILASNWLLVSHGRQAGIGQVATLVAVCVLVWVLVIVARILRSATGWPMVSTALLTLSIQATIGLVYLGMYPPAAPAAPAS